MSTKNNHLDIKPDEKVCFNCKHIIWLVALGQGVRCGYDFYKNNNKVLFPISHLRHTCDKFENKKYKDE
jgi:hypothetical protein